MGQEMAKSVPNQVLFLRVRVACSAAYVRRCGPRSRGPD